MPWAAAAAAVVGIAGAASSADASRSAANAQGDAAKKGMGEQRREYDISRADTANYRDAGNASVLDLGTMLGQERQGVVNYQNDPRYQAIYQQVYNDADQAHRLSQGNRSLAAAQAIDPDAYNATMARIQQIAQDQFTKQYPDVAAQTNASDPRFGMLTKTFSANDLANDPIYQKALDWATTQGTQAINRGAAARGGLDSGSTLKGVTDYALGQASTLGNDAYNRFRANQADIYNKLAGVAGLGQISVGQVNSAGMNAANQTTDLMTGAGNARAAGIVGGANAWNGGLTNASNVYSNQYTLDKVLNAYGQKNNTTGGTGYGSNVSYTPNNDYGFNP